MAGAEITFQELETGEAPDVLVACAHGMRRSVDLVTKMRATGMVAFYLSRGLVGLQGVEEKKIAQAFVRPKVVAITVSERELGENEVMRLIVGAISSLRAEPAIISTVEEEILQRI